MVWTTQHSNAFTGSDGTALETHDSNWAKVTGSPVGAGMQIGASNQLESLGQAVYVLTGVTLANKQAAEIDLHSVANFNGVGVRHDGDTVSAEDYDAYYVFVNGSTAYLYRRDANGTTGAWTLLDSQSVSWSAGDTLRIEADGSSITTLKNASATGMPSATDSNHTSGYAAVRCYVSVDPFADNFLAEDESAGGGASIPVFMHHYQQMRGA